MRLLLDTHSFLWVQTQPARLSRLVRSFIESSEHEVYLSAVSCWEIAIKAKLGKLRIPDELARAVESAAVQAGFSCLSVSFRHAQAAGQLPLLHRDPFDRMLIAQALEEDLVLVSNETMFDSYGVRRVW